MKESKVKNLEERIYKTHRDELLHALWITFAKLQKINQLSPLDERLWAQLTVYNSDRRNEEKKSKNVN